MSRGLTYTQKDVTFAVWGAFAAHLIIICFFVLPPPRAIEMDVSDEHAKPIAVEITPVAFLKAGSSTPAKIPSRWERQKPQQAQPAATSAPDESGKLSTHADSKDAPKPQDAGAPAISSLRPDGWKPPSDDAGATASNDTPAGPGPSAPGAGDPNGSADGTETDPLKARAADMYRAQLASWFAARFNIRGKILFDELKSLKATATISTSADRHVIDFSVTSSGNAVFDEELRATLTRIKNSGIELPAPPPLYPDMLGRSLPISFRCTVRSQCE